MRFRVYRVQGLGFSVYRVEPKGSEVSARLGRLYITENSDKQGTDRCLEGTENHLCMLPVPPTGGKYW